MKPAIERYKNMTASALCTDPFFQEWVFHPLGPDQVFWMDLLISPSPISNQIQLAQQRLLQFEKECSMIAITVEAYTKMKETLCRETNVEHCYGITEDYWNVIRAGLVPFEFAKNEHEIHFFKYIKPLFTGEREYFSLRHHAELFSGNDGKFWQRQPQRLAKFKIENEAFIERYTSGDTRFDEWWFCRGEHRDQTARDGLVASYLGLIRYLQFVDTQLQS